MLLRIVFILIIIFANIGCHENNHHDNLTSTSASSLEQWLAHSKAPIYDFKIVHIYPHDGNNFTEGLLLENDYLYESAGLYQQSKLEKKDFITGKVLREYVLPTNYFAEGITIIGNHIYQLTYKEHTGFVYDKNIFQLEKIFHYSTEGWGLTSDGKQLIMSDGSAQLFFIDPNTFRITRTILVKDQNQTVNFLNELEYIQGKIYANIWPTDIIAIISPDNGKVLGWINIKSLNTRANCAVDNCVSNGIAYREKSDSLLVTGKNWLHMYEIKLVK
jgi:glutaminyl-peptide cyclotransferase